MKLWVLMSVLQLERTVLQLERMVQPLVPLVQPLERTVLQLERMVQLLVPLVQPLERTALGLALAERLTARPDIAQAIRAELQGLDRRTARDELDLLRRYAGQVGPDDETARREPALPPPSSVKTRSADLPAAGSGSARISFQLSGPQGPVQCIATDGRIELRLVRDFSQIGRERLQAAVQALLDRLG